MPSIYDVAKLAGVSPATVSRAYSRPGRVHEATLTKILAAAEELGYRSRQIESVGDRERTKRIGLLVVDTANPYFTEIIRGAVAAANEVDYSMVLLDSQESTRREEQSVRNVSGQLDGMILAAPRMPDAPIRAAAREVPVVLIARQMPEVASIMPNISAGVQEALSHLAAIGHRQVTYISGPASSYASNLRWKSLRQFAPQYGQEVRMIGPVSPITLGGESAARLFASNPTSAVICFNDLVALGFIKELHRMGISVPRDVSVIGNDNIPGCEWIAPSLTTIAAPFSALGSTAVHTVLNMINGIRGSLFETTVLPTHLIVRQSTSAVRSA